MQIFTTDYNITGFPNFLLMKFPDFPVHFTFSRHILHFKYGLNLLLGIGIKKSTYNITHASLATYFPKFHLSFSYCKNLTTFTYTDNPALTVIDLYISKCNI